MVMTPKIVACVEYEQDCLASLNVLHHYVLRGWSIVILLCDKALTFFIYCQLKLHDWRKSLCRS